MNVRIFAVAALLLLSACSRPPPEGEGSDEGRPETRGIEAADPIGYDGRAIRKKVDKVLDLNDQRTQQLDQEIEKNTQ